MQGAPAGITPINKSNAVASFVPGLPVTTYVGDALPPPALSNFLDSWLPLNPSGVFISNSVDASRTVNLVPLWKSRPPFPEKMWGKPRSVHLRRTGLQNGCGFKAERMAPVLGMQLSETRSARDCGITNRSRKRDLAK